MGKTTDTDTDREDEDEDVDVDVNANTSTDTETNTSVDIVTIGETMLRLSPPAGVRITQADEFAVHVGGAESNVAVIASQLGCETSWISKLPASPLGRRIITTLRGHDVEVDITWDESDNSRVGTYYFEPGGEPRGDSVHYDRAGSSVTTLSAAEISLETVRSASTCYMSGITPALSETVQTTVETVLQTAQSAGTQTAFDLNYRSKLWDTTAAAKAYRSLLPHIDILIGAERDVEACLGLDADPESVVRELASTFDLETVVLTRGESGAVALYDDTIFEQPVYNAETIDAVGTGDAFVGGFLARRLDNDHSNHNDIDDALATGAAAAAVKRTIKGDTAAITPAEIAAVRDTDSSGSISR
ncbi:bifunctional 2-dehydro-3-deoxygluconokinase/2-dehydro-3-deoxygalactonokinase [Haloquadratum walsbyi]|uniref:Sugar kinase, ribokinase family n=1 Tax=Haloquadratum walsbyi J07HQW2 TaxID=1238425 RepID=U1PR21_9EURY|nr:bifunctional 2-dehydro-3-deoxygluconokinase/2-dehydro-3-deoxygalactonokinase [Haloquadratum walsbyi]ERG96222.1 MAG: sugar kinase, ribokinase family [Haloquadratum walsbyi J07HQW2]